MLSTEDDIESYEVAISKLRNALEQAGTNEHPEYVATLQLLITRLPEKICVSDIDYETAIQSLKDMAMLMGPLDETDCHTKQTSCADLTQWDAKGSDQLGSMTTKGPSNEGHSGIPNVWDWLTNLLPETKGLPDPDGPDISESLRIIRGCMTKLEFMAHSILSPTCQRQAPKEWGQSADLLAEFKLVAGKIRDMKKQIDLRLQSVDHTPHGVTDKPSRTCQASRTNPTHQEPALGEFLRNIVHDVDKTFSSYVSRTPLPMRAIYVLARWYMRAKSLVYNSFRYATAGTHKASHSMHAAHGSLHPQSAGAGISSLRTLSEALYISLTAARPIEDALTEFVHGREPPVLRRSLTGPHTDQDRPIGGRDATAHRRHSSMK